MRLATHTATPVAQARCRHPTGILDITARTFRGLPVALIAPCDDRYTDFTMEGLALDETDVRLASFWMLRIGGRVIGDLRDAGVAETADPMPRHRPDHDQGLEFTSLIPDLR